SAAMALNDKAVQAEKERTIGCPRIELARQYLEGAARKNISDARQERTRHCLTQIINHEPRRALCRLERDVTGVTIRHHHIDRALGDVVAFHETVELTGEMRAAQYLCRALYILRPLDLFLTDIEKPDGRLLQIEKDTCKRLAHRGELHELMFVRSHCRPKIKRNTFATRRRPDSGERRTLHIRHRLEDDLRHCHQRARIAGRDSRLRATFLHRINGAPHAANLAATTKRLARLVIHRHGNIRVNEIRCGSDTRIFCKDRSDNSFIAENDEADARMSDQRNVRAADHSRRTMISTH